MFKFNPQDLKYLKYVIELCVVEARQGMSILVQWELHGQNSFPCLNSKIIAKSRKAKEEEFSDWEQFFGKGTKSPVLQCL